MNIDIINLIKTHSEIKVVSFDVFDTLIFRTATKPTDVFAEMYKSETCLFPDFINAEDWVNSRTVAERNARNKALKEKGSTEVMLEDIYNELPLAYENREELLRLEIDTEKKCCFINDEIYDTIEYIVHNNIADVVLVSDMYLKASELSEILEYNSIDTGLFKKIFMSSEYGCSKRKTGLYEIVCNEMSISVDELLHIGDNIESDIGSSNMLGIKNYCYDIISGAPYRYPHLLLENLAFKNACSYIHPLRIIASEKGKNLTAEEKILFDIGAAMAGPFITYGVEWVLDVAEKNDINIIRPIMREGDLLSVMLKNAAASSAKNELSIEPLYMSRHTVMAANFENITYEDVVYLFTTHNITIKMIFDILNIGDYIGEFSKYSNLFTNNTKSIEYNGMSLYNAILKYFKSEDTLQIIRKRNENSSANIIKYMQQMNMTQKCITLDIGWRGSIQSAIDSLQRDNFNISNVLHLLFIGTATVATNALNSNIQGFLSTFGGCSEDFRRIFVRIFELMFYSDKGTTCGYKEENGKITPVTLEVDYPEWQKKAMKIVQKGILAFQETYLKYVKFKPHLRSLINNPEELLKPLERLFSYPMKKEAEIFGNLLYDQNFGANTLTPVIGKNLIEKAKKDGLKSLYSISNTENITWYSGLNVIAIPSFYYDMLLHENKAYSKYSYYLLLENTLTQISNKKIVLLGAGVLCRELLKFLSGIGMLDRIAGIADNNKQLQGRIIAGITVTPVEFEYDSDVYLCTVLGKNANEALYRQVVSSTNGKGVFISRFDVDF